MKLNKDLKINKLFILTFILLSLLLISATSVSATAVDFTAWTEVDEGSDITIVNSTKVSWSSLSQTDDGYVYKDYGVGYFDEDFVHDVTFYTASSPNNGYSGSAWTLTNELNDYFETAYTNGNRIYTLKQASATGNVIFVYDDESGVSCNLPLNTEYYARIVRDKNYGIISAGIYSTETLRDSGNGIDGDLCNLRLPWSDGTAFRYLMVGQTYDNNDAARFITGYAEDLKLNETNNILTYSDYAEAHINFGNSNGEDTYYHINPYGTEGILNGAVELDGDDYLQFGTNLTTTETKMSISLWYESKGGLGVTRDNLITNRDDNSAGLNYVQLRRDLDDRIIFSTYNVLDNTYVKETDASTSGIHHMVITVDCDADNISMYRDGEYMNSSEFTQDYVPYDLHDFYIGAERDSVGTIKNFWVGSIDDVAMWTDVLTPTEVANIYDSGSPTNGALSVKSNDLVYYNDMDALYDQTGNGNVFRTSNSPYQDKDTGEIIDDSMYFDGTDVTVSILNYTALSPGTQDWTMSIWFNTTNTDGDRNLFSAHTGNGIGEDWFRINKDTNHKIALITDDGSTVATITSPSTYNDGEWHHVVVRRNSSIHQWEMLIDNVSVGTDDSQTGGFDFNTAMTIGRYSIASEEWLGNIDEVTIWNMLLNDEDISEIYNSGEGLEYPFTTHSQVMINTYRTYPLNPLVAQNVTLNVNATSNTASISWCNFTAQLPNGTYVINNVNGTNYNDDIWNSTSFNVSSYGQYNWSVVCSDEGGNTDTLSTSFTVTNSPPSIDYINVSDQAPYANQTLEGYCTVSDYESDPLTINYSWFVNDNVTTLGLVNTTVLNLSYYYVDDEVIFSCSADDGTTESVSNYSVSITNFNLTVQNITDDSTPTTPQVGDLINFDADLQSLMFDPETCLVELKPTNSSVVFDTVLATINTSTNTTADASFTITSSYTSQYDNVSYRFYCNDTHGNYGYSDYSYFSVVDSTPPDFNITFSPILINGTVVDNVLREEVIINVTFTDLNLFQASINVTCNEYGPLFYWEILDINTSTYSTSQNVNISGLDLQRCNISLMASDDHTAAFIPAYDYQIQTDQVSYSTENDINVLIRSNESTESVDTTKLIDRYVFEFEYADPELTRTFILQSSDEIYVREYSNYPGHFVIWNNETHTGNWVDFAMENGDDFDYTVNEVNSSTYEITMSHKVLAHPELIDEFIPAKRDTFWSIIVDFFTPERPLTDEKKVYTGKQNFISLGEPITQSSLDTITDRVLYDQQKLEEFKEDYGIKKVKFNSIGGTNVAEQNSYFFIGGVFNISSYNQYNYSQFTDFSANVTESTLPLPLVQYNFSLPNSNYIQNVSEGTYTFNFSHPHYIDKNYTINMSQAVNATDLVYNTSQSLITFKFYNVKSLGILSNYTVYVIDDTNNVTKEFNVTDGTDGITIPLNAELEYDILFVKEDYVNTTTTYTFDYKEVATYDIYVSYIATIELIDEDTLGPFDISVPDLVEMQVFCENVTVTTVLNETNEINETNSTTDFFVPITCAYEKFKFVSTYTGGDTFYRTQLVGFNESVNQTIYLIDHANSAYVYTAFYIDDLLGLYDNPSIYVRKQIDIGTVTIHSDFTDIEGKVGTYLLENDEYLIEVHSDNRADEIIGSYSADIGEEKVISLYDVELSSTPSGFAQSVRYTMNIQNISNVSNIVFAYFDAESKTDSVQFKVYENKYNDTLLYTSPVYTNVSQFGHLVWPITGYENSTLVGELIIQHEDEGEIQIADTVQKIWATPLPLMDYVSAEFMNWFFTILLSVVAIYAGSNASYAALAVVGLGVMFVLFGWYGLSITALGLALLVSLIETLIKKGK